MTVDETDSMEWSNGDCGYMVKGHVDLKEFLEAIQTFEVNEGYVGSADEAPYDVRHRYCRDAPPENFYISSVVFCASDDPGAYPVTVAGV
jgi:hypothetical protein